MELVDGSGRPLKNAPAEVLDAQGNPTTSAKEAPMTIKELGKSIASDWLNKATKAPTNELVNNQFDILYAMALNIIAHRVTNKGLGMEEGNAIAEWDASRAFAAEKEVQEHLSETIQEWKNDYFNGELVFTPGKPT